MIGFIVLNARCAFCQQLTHSTSSSVYVISDVQIEKEKKKNKYISYLKNIENCIEVVLIVFKVVIY